MDLTDSQSWIPTNAYLYFPSEIECKGADSQRMIFDGNTQFTSNEHRSIDQFKIHAQKHKYTLKPMWTDNMILRFLYANNFKMDKTLASIKEHTVWRETCIPVKVDKPLLDFLNSGILYIHGRDHKFRPIVVLNMYMLSSKTLDVDLVIRGMTYWFEILIDKWFLPGQVENWVFVTNMKGMGIANLVMTSIRRIFSYLQENYKCRLHSMFVLNTPTAVYIPWQIVKKFLDEVTVKKIQFLKGDIPTNLFTYTNKSQVEIQHGGTARNITRFWPPTVDSDDYFVSKEDEKDLVTREQYTELYRNGKLKDMTVNHALIIPKQPVYVHREREEDEFIFDVDYVEEMSECFDSKEFNSKLKLFKASFLEELNIVQQR